MLSNNIECVIAKIRRILSTLKKKWGSSETLSNHAPLTGYCYSSINLKDSEGHLLEDVIARHRNQNNSQKIKYHRSISRWLFIVGNWES